MKTANFTTSLGMSSGLAASKWVGLSGVVLK
jgi:hypothetical protein